VTTGHDQRSSGKRQAALLVAGSNSVPTPVHAGNIKVVTCGFIRGRIKPDTAIWPIYRNHEMELAVLGDRKSALIVEYGRHHKAGTLSYRNSGARLAAAPTQQKPSP
jgi:hypothetical protein